MEAGLNFLEDDLEVTIELLHRVYTRRQAVELESQSCSDAFRERTGRIHAQHALAKLVAQDVDAQEFPGQKQCRTRTAVEADEQRRRTGATLLNLGRSHAVVRVEFANAGTATAEIGRTEYHVAAQRPGSVLACLPKKRSGFQGVVPLCDSVCGCTHGTFHIENVKRVIMSYESC